MIEDIKSCQPEVEASQSDKWLQSYGQLMISDLLPEDPNMHMSGSEISQIFWGITPRPPLSHLQKGIYDCIGQVYTDASTNRPRHYQLLQIILTTLNMFVPTGS